MGRPGDRRGQPRHRPAVGADHPGAPLRRVRHHRQLHRLPLRGRARGLAIGAGSIGYADASQAGDLGTAAIGVGDGFELPTAEAAAKILEVSPKADTAGETALVYDLDHTTEEAGVYPIVLSSYLIACPSYADAAEAELVKDYLGYVLSDEGQEAAAESAGSAPLPAAIAEKARAVVDGITGG